MTQETPNSDLPATGARTVALAGAAFLLVVGLPAALFFYAGRVEVALGLLGVFAVMVVATAYALRKAVEAERDAEP